MSAADEEPTSDPADGHSQVEHRDTLSDTESAEAGPWTDVSGDDRDEGWGEPTEPPEGLTDDWYLSERPPHHQ